MSFGRDRMSTSENLIIRLLPEIVSLQQLLLQQQRHIMDTLANLVVVREALQAAVVQILAKLDELMNRECVDPAGVQAEAELLAAEVQKLHDAAVA